VFKPYVLTLNSGFKGDAFVREPTEVQLINASLPSWSKHDLVKHLQTIGVKQGMTLLVHSSLRSMGYIIGGVETVLEALIEAVGAEGTVVMPAFSAQLSDPATWRDPVLPESWVQKMLSTTPPFNNQKTVTWGLSVIAEQFRRWPGVVRSTHPIDSFCAYGKNAIAITEHHSLNFSLGMASPLGKIYLQKGSVLLLGVGYDVNSSLHLAEHLSKTSPVVSLHACMKVDNQAKWVEYQDNAYDSGTFTSLGEAFEEEIEKTFSQEDHAIIVSTGRIGSANSKLILQSQLVDFAINYFCTKP
jgi:aminoglycoside 3-N-acetyltransferase